MTSLDLIADEKVSAVKHTVKKKSFIDLLEGLKQNFNNLFKKSKIQQHKNNIRGFFT